MGEKILAVLGSPYQLGDIEYRSTASVGATVFRGHQASIDELLKQADLAMYKSKESGRNAVCFFDPDMQTVVVERAALEAGLRNAIEDNQFLLHYQAQVDGTRDHRRRGAGALAASAARHRAAGRFHSAGRRNRLILALGSWVLEAACAQLARWATRPDMAHLTIAVNVSVQQFREPDFVEKVLAIIGRTGARPGQVETGTDGKRAGGQRAGHHREDECAQSEWRRLRARRFRHRLFVAVLSEAAAIGSVEDRPLLCARRSGRSQRCRDCQSHRGARAQPRFGVIAEGVETEAQRDFLAAAGCHAYQGYYFCRPLPIEGFEEFAALGRMKQEAARAY